MFRFLDDDTDMYNTPYTYNAGRLVSLLAMNTLCLAMRGRTSHFFLTTLSARFQFLQLGRCFCVCLSLFLFSACVTKKCGSFLMQMRPNTLLSASSPLLVYSRLQECLTKI